MNYDRTKQAFASAVLAQVPAIDYLASYGGKVVSQGGANAFDFQPDDPRIPDMSGIPIRLPFPGFQLTINAGASPRAMAGWDGGDPSKPQIRLWEDPGLATLVVTASQKQSFVADQVNLGGDPASDQALKGSSFLEEAVTPLVEAWSVFQEAVAIWASALTTYQQGIQPVADTGNSVTPAAVAANSAITAAAEALTTAAQAFQSAVQAALSTVVNLS